MKKFTYLLTFLLALPLWGDFAAPPVDGTGLRLGSRIYPSLFFRPSASDISFRPMDAIVEGRWKVLVILVDFSDYSYRATGEIPSTPQYFHDMIAGGSAYPFRSMNDFYLENSNGRFGIGSVDVYGWYTLPHTRAYYACSADSDQNAAASCDSNNAYGFVVTGGLWYPAGVLNLVNDALDILYTENPSLDLEQYDNDGDGMPESIFIIHAGEGGEATRDPLDIWSHRNIYSYSGSVSSAYSGTFVYIMGPELFSSSDTMPIRMGVFAHEFGHTLGLPDLYDTDYSSCGDGPYSLMAYGVHTGTPPGSNPYPLDAWLKIKLGWAYPVDITINTCGRIVYPIQISNVVYRYNPDGGSEYFLVAFRKDYGFDHQMFANLSSNWKGAVYIWHVDESKGNGYLNPFFPYNTQECVPGGDRDCSKYHYALSLEQADGLFQLENTQAGGGCSVPDWGDLYHSGDIFSMDTTPNSNWWDGKSSNFTVDVVKVTDDYAKVNFIVDPDFTLSPPEIFSIPKTSVAAGELYEYRVDATGYGLSYELVEGPEGMKIDPATGILTWRPGKDDVGSHRVVVNVENCGGYDTQEFILVVYESKSQGCSTVNGGSTGDLFQIVLLLLTYGLLRKRYSGI